MSNEEIETKVPTKVSIKVSDPQQDPTKSFITYLVSGVDSLGDFQIRRRYNDFFYFREALRKRWPGLYIPPIPQKKLAIGGGDQHQLQYRKKLFNYFMEQLTHFQHLFSCTITQEFLRNQTMSMQKYYPTVCEPPISELIQEYKNLFKCHDYKENVTANRAISTKFSSFLRGAEKQLKVLIHQLEIIAEARNNFTESLHACNTIMLPEYEKNIYAQYLIETHRDGTLLFVHDQQIQENIRKLREKTNGTNSFQHFQDMLIFESKQLEAFLQSIQSKQEQQTHKYSLQQKCLENKSELSKLIGGKFTFKSIFNKGSKEEQIKELQKGVPEMQKKIEQLQQFTEILNAVQALVEIPNFKENKKQQYYEMLNMTSQKQLQFLGAYGELMASVMEGLNKKNLVEQ